MNEKRNRKPLLFGGMLVLLLALITVFAGVLVAAPAEDVPAQDGGTWFWQTTHTVAEANAADEEIVVVEGQVGELVDPAEWNRYTFSDGDGEILANFADDLPDGAIPKNVTVRIFGEAEDGEIDVQGLEVLETVALSPSATAAEINSGDFNQQQVSIQGEVGEKDSDYDASWNYFAFTDDSGATIVDLPDTDEMPDDLIPTDRVSMIFGQAKNSDHVDSDHILVASFEAAAAPPPPAAFGAAVDLVAGIPEPADAKYQAQDNIQEGGRHFFYTSAAAPADIANDFQAGLEAAGWTIEDTSSGGDPFGFFSGASVKATNDSRYLYMNAGGPAGKSFIDICVWPSMPDDNHCGQPQQQTSDGSPIMGVDADLLAGIPEPEDAVFKAEDVIQENGRHFFYTATKAPADVVGNYEKALTAAGWTIEDSGGGGDPFGLFGSGAGLTATNEDRYLKVNAGGPPGSTFVDVCVWPAQPSDDDCGQNNRNNAASAAFGAGGDLVAGIPEPANAEFQSNNAVQEGGQHFFYTATKAPANMVTAFEAALIAAGWTIEDIGGGGDPFGFASGAGLTATNDSRYLKMNAGGPTGSTYIDICVWPSEPNDNQCDQNNRITTGTATLGASGDLLSGVPELQADFKAEDAIHEGGRHFFFTSADAPPDVITAYGEAMTDAGWSILSSGGDPFGMFGAGLTASDGTRYVKVNAGGPGDGTTFIDACIWPARPSDDDCDQPDQTRGSLQLGSGGSLLANVPELTGADFQAQDPIQESGRHFFYTTSSSPDEILSTYGTALINNGWEIEDMGGGGDPTGTFGGGGLTATNGDRYLKLNAGGPAGNTFVDICVWPTQPNDDNCGQNSNQNSTGVATIGAATADLLVDVPELDAEFKAEDAIQEGGRHYFFTSTGSAADLVGGYETALTTAGWEILNSGGGGDPFGFFGGAGLTATDGTRYLKLNAGGPTGKIFIDGCVWPTQPVDDNCGQNNNNNN